MRRALLSAALALLSACAVAPPSPAPVVAQVVAPAHRAALAPTGVLRVGVYLGSPTSLVRDASGPPRGVALELGQAFAERLGVPAQVLEFARLAAVLDALKAGQVDFTVTNATAVRAQEMDFSAPLLVLELGVLVLPGSRLGAVDAMDSAGLRIGVAQGSSSQAALGQRLKQARVVAAPSLQVAAQMLSRGELDAFATNKGILFEMADGLAGARVLDGRWGTEHLAIAVPKGRGAAMDEVRRFAAEAAASGRVQRAAERAGLRGTAPATSPATSP